MRRILLTTLTICAFASPAMACLWDDDTLAHEAKGIEDVVSVILGAFPRNPAKYFEMRLEAAEAAIAKDPTDWAVYDNAGVACDRLGKCDKAIAMMEAKAKAMQDANFDASKEPQPNHSYRLKANLGTFYVHRWIKTGADWAKMDDVTKAKEQIAAAIKENPDAHFGREIYQLKALEWLVSKPIEVKPSFNKYGSPTNAYPDIMGLHKMAVVRSNDAAAFKKQYNELEKMLKGLAGLIKMGNAWRSLDVLYAMQIIAARQD
ncbi:MAG: hypothetical protein KDB07_09030, partial [Planctomycetes bacterium]|nr:hypothetical protein [Planctomycetota bacterium]